MLVCAFLCATLHTRPRVQRAPGIPCSLLDLRDNEVQSSGNHVARRRSHAPCHPTHVIPDKRATRAQIRDPYAAAAVAFNALIDGFRSIRTCNYGSSQPSPGLRGTFGAPQNHPRHPEAAVRSTALEGHGHSRARTAALAPQDDGSNILCATNIGGYGPRASPGRRGGGSDAKQLQWILTASPCPRPHATSAASAAGPAPRCASSRLTISALGRARLNRKP